jgi:hypothetical protein
MERDEVKIFLEKFVTIVLPNREYTGKIIAVDDKIVSMNDKFGTHVKILIASIIAIEDIDLVTRKNKGLPYVN